MFELKSHRVQLPSGASFVTAGPQLGAHEGFFVLGDNILAYNIDFLREYETGFRYRS